MKVEKVHDDGDKRLIVEGIADEIMSQTNKMLSGLPPAQRRRVIEVLDEVYRVRLNAKEVG
jgi:glycerol-3-phosphate cytidylyltransferase-like family protein